MKINKESNTYTVVFSIMMVLIVGFLLSGLSVYLKPKIKKNQELETMQNILLVMNVTGNNQEAISKDSVVETFEKYIGNEQYTIKNGKISRTKNAFKIDLKKERASFLNDQDYIQKYPFFVGINKGKRYFIIPVLGNGLWGRIWGYVSLNEELNKIQGAVFDHEKETAGLGANITEHYFREDFKEENILNEKGKYVGVTVSKNNADPLNKDKKDNEVDALSGATITSNGVSKMLKKGIAVYLPHLKEFKKTH
ncbi:NADH:ubiquinone reductase (Na(+)-transporting) subunit C [Abyssalbus ytuae]|uniref:Na(+)-translocating NADH-quinone reductase subunit C n=1 Tax=Abyssalbus ytuae TaxID=2926907 RepID=A0A9E6ZKC4_9FLAO|nr:NADH:ubiquinone reductase (Na(+)-transporting) subunit C [Abyssalbus ytuae]UOB16144.1 NADH:ubiquinone reductase (Na(+)-transporting) subunit C [Abyssalbus ytuae]